MWEKVVGMIHSAFREGHPVEYFTWKTVILIPKGKNGLLRYRFGVGVVEDGDRYTELPPDVGD